MICAPGNTGVAILRAAEESEAEAIQAVLEASSSHDDPASWSGGGWGLMASGSTCAGGAFTSKRMGATGQHG